MHVDNNNNVTANKPLTTLLPTMEKRDSHHHCHADQYRKNYSCIVYIHKHTESCCSKFFLASLEETPLQGIATIYGEEARLAYSY